MAGVSEQELYRELRQYGNIIFLCHRLADVDSFGSAYALARLFGGDVGVKDSLSSLASYLAVKLGQKVKENPDIRLYDMVVVVDTSTPAQAGYDIGMPCAVIDHHAPGELVAQCQFSLSMPGVASTAEIVYGIYQKSGTLIDKDVAFALSLAIVTDTGGFRHASHETFTRMASILREGGIHYADIADFLSAAPQDISSRIAAIKAAQRLSLTRAGDFLIVTTNVSSFGAQAAGALIGLGADVAFVGSDGDEKRIAGRVRRGVSLDLPALLGEVCKAYGGAGGGHPSAAGAVIKGDLEPALAECVRLAEKALQK